MNPAKFDINQQIEEIYGFKAKPFNVPSQPFQEQYTERTKAQIFQDIGGTPYYLPVIIGGMQIRHCVVAVTAQKIIVETPMVARRGSVKELISTDDYRISIDGFLHRPDGSYPDTEIDELVQLFEKNEALVMKSALTDYFILDEDKVIIKKLDFPSQKGKLNVKYFKMDVVSDSIFDLEL